MPDMPVRVRLGGGGGQRQGSKPVDAAPAATAAAANAALLFGGGGGGGGGGASGLVPRDSERGRLAVHQAEFSPEQLLVNGQAMSPELDRTCDRPVSSGTHVHACVGPQPAACRC